MRHQSKEANIKYYEQEKLIKTIPKPEKIVRFSESFQDVSGRDLIGDLIPEGRFL